VLLIPRVTDRLLVHAGLCAVNAVHPIKVQGPAGASGIRYEAERAFKNVQAAVTSCDLGMVLF
jgi:hypothetical protein